MSTRTSTNERMRKAAIGMAILFLTGMLVSTAMAERATAAKEPLNLIDRRGKIELRHAHFEDVMQYYKEHFDIDVRLDVAALNELGIDLNDKKKVLKAHRKHMLDSANSLKEKLLKIGIRTAKYAELFQDIATTPYPGIELVVDDISLHSALTIILREIDPEVSYRIVDNVVEITSREVISENLETRIFLVEDLVRWERAEPTGPFAPVPLETPEANYYDYDPLIELLTTTVESDSWEEAGGTGRISEGHKTLVVSQTPRNLRRIEATIAVLRKAVARADKISADLRPVRIEISAAAAEARSRIETALSRTIEMKYKQTPLNEIVDDLAKRLAIPIRVDQLALGELGINGNMPVSISVTNGTAGHRLHSALKRIDQELTFIIDEEILIVTTEEVASERLEIMIYPVLDLVERTGNPNGIKNLDFDTVIQIITTTVGPDSWEEAGGAGRVSEYESLAALVVAQTDDVHQDTLALLTELRRIEAERAKSDAAKKAEKPEETDDFVTVVFLLWQPNDKETHVKETDLVKLLKETVAMESWKEDEVSVRTLPSRLIIRQRKSVHRKVYEVLIGLQVLKPVAPSGGFGGSGGFSQGGAGGGFGGGGFGGGGSGSLDASDLDGGGLNLGSAGQLPPDKSDSTPTNGGGNK